jgi:hypothetical protein
MFYTFQFRCFSIESIRGGSFRVSAGSSVMRVIKSNAIRCFPTASIKRLVLSSVAFCLLFKLVIGITFAVFGELVFVMGTE